MNKNKKWLRCYNPFIRFINFSIPKFYFFSKRCLDILENRSSDVVISNLFQDTLPVFNEFEKIVFNKFSNISNRKGCVISMKDKFLELKTTKLPVWEAIIIQKYNKKSAAYSVLFPKGRMGISTGSYSKRLHHLESMYNQLVDYPELIDLYTDVVLFYNELNQIYIKKQLKESDVQFSATVLREAARKMAVRLFVNLGYLTAHFAEEPDRIYHFFPMNALIKKPKTKNEKANTVKRSIIKQTIIEAGINFMMKDVILISLVKGEKIKIWFSQTKDTITIPESTIEILQGEETEIEVRNYAGIDDRFLMIANTSVNEQAKIELTLLD